MTPRAPRAGHPPSRTDLAEAATMTPRAPRAGHPPSRTDLAEAATMTPRAPRAGRRLVTLGSSLALHGGLLLAVLLAVSGETDPARPSSAPPRGCGAEAPAP